MTNLKDKKYYERVLGLKFTSQSFMDFLNDILIEEFERLEKLGYEIDRKNMEFIGRKPKEETILYYNYAGKIRDFKWNVFLEKKFHYQNLALRHMKVSLNNREKRNLKDAYLLKFIEKILKKAEEQPEKFIAEDLKKTLSKKWRRGTSFYNIDHIYSPKEKRIRYDEYTKSLYKYDFYTDELDQEEKNHIKEDFKEMIEASKSIKFVDTKLRLLKIIEEA